MNNCVTIKLSKDEALVFFDFLNRFNQQENSFEHQAEERILWDIESLLEKQLQEIFQMDYPILLTQARNKIRDKE